jgi:colanic acid biosynthesis glycosyl transferase WcaI
LSAPAQTTPTPAAELLLVAQYYWPEQIGSAPFMTDLARWFVQRGERVTVLASRPHYPEFEVREGYRAGERDEEQVEGARVVRVPTYAPRGGRALLRLLSDAQMLAGALLALARGRVTRASRVVSLCPSILAVLAGSLATRARGRHIAVIHDIQSGMVGGLRLLSGKTLTRMLRGIETRVLNRTDLVIVLTESMKKALHRQGVRAPIEVLPIWVDPERLFPTELPRQGRAPLVLYSGNLGRKQGLLQVVEMAEILQRRLPEARVVLRGEGSQRLALERYVREHRLANVEFDALSAPERLNEQLNEADVHVVPQEPDAADYAIPSKIYALMSAGQAFVCTASRGSALGSLQQETGAFRCTPPHDAPALAAAVEALIRDPEARRELGRSGRSWVQAHASRTAVLSRLTQLLDGAGMA